MTQCTLLPASLIVQSSHGLGQGGRPDIPEPEAQLSLSIQCPPPAWQEAVPIDSEWCKAWPEQTARDSSDHSIDPCTSESRADSRSPAARASAANGLGSETDGQIHAMPRQTSN